MGHGRLGNSLQMAHQDKKNLFCPRFYICFVKKRSSKERGANKHLQKNKNISSEKNYEYARTTITKKISGNGKVT